MSAFVTEEWRPIPGFAGYFASSEGRIASEAKDGRRRVLRQWAITTEHRGQTYVYPAVCLRRDNKQRCHRSVGRYVLMAFSGKDDSRLVCRHEDNDPFNNAPSNLVWGTPRDNARDRTAKVALGRGT